MDKILNRCTVCHHAHWKDDFCKNCLEQAKLSGMICRCSNPISKKDIVGIATKRCVDCRTKRRKELAKILNTKLG